MPMVAQIVIDSNDCFTKVAAQTQVDAGSPAQAELRPPRPKKAKRGRFAHKKRRRQVAGAFWLKL
jgi:hypothetical protein